MSFPKVLNCDNCKQYFSIFDEAFPEDLYDLISQRKIDQLFWICKRCKLEKDERKKEVKANVNKTDVSRSLQCIENLNRSVTSDPTNMLERSFDSMNLSDCCNSDEHESSSQKSILHSSSKSPQNKGAHKILETILAKSKPDEANAKKCKEVVKDFMNKTIEELRKEPEFNSIFTEPYYTGSFYNDMRITSANEYDVNIVFKLPQQISLELEFFEDKYMFTKIKWKMLENLPENKSIILKFLDNNSLKSGECMYLSQKKMNSWFQSLMAKYVKDTKCVKVNQSGPARRVRITTECGLVVYIDLVPVFYIDYSIFEPYPSVWNILKKYPVKKIKELCFLVPKPLKINDDGCSWKLDFPEVEKAILNRKACVKPVIRLIKLLRDNMDWKDIASYFIKTVVLHEIDKHPDAEYWEEHYLYERFMEVLAQLRSHLNERQIPFFFATNCNLISEFNEDQCQNWSNKLGRLINQFHSDYNEFYKVLKVDVK